MEISATEEAGHRLLRVSGRLDGHWAGHLTQALDQELRDGRDRVSLDLSGLAYISSLGLRVLVGAHQRFRAAGGSFTVSGVAGNVRQVLQMAGLLALLEGPAAAPPPAPTDAARTTRRVLHDGVAWEIFPGSPEALPLELYGEPGKLARGDFMPSHLQRIGVHPGTLGLGLGAFGEDLDGNLARVGEYLSLAGAAACQPAGSATSCDTLLTEGDYVPDLHALYGLRVGGSPGLLMRFEPGSDSRQPALSTIAGFVLETLGTKAACVVIAAESDGLVGATLRRSPLAAAGDFFAFPAVREHVALVAERAHAGMSVIACGIVVAGDAPPALDPFVRPLAGEADPMRGHLHAAVFQHRPLRRGALTMESAVRPFFEHDVPQAVLHLLGDDREAVPEETRLRRGACWVAPLQFPAGAR